MSEKRQSSGNSNRRQTNSKRQLQTVINRKPTATYSSRQQPTANRQQPTGKQQQTDSKPTANRQQPTRNHQLKTDENLLPPPSSRESSVAFRFAHLLPFHFRQTPYDTYPFTPLAWAVSLGRCHSRHRISTRFISIY